MQSRHYQDESIYYKTDDSHVLTRGIYSARPLYFINTPVRNGSLFTWLISENLRYLGQQIAYQPDPEGIRDFLCYGFVPAPRTIFKNIIAVPPGTICYLSFTSDQPKWERVTTINDRQESTPSESTFWRQICKHAHLKKAAVLLSGGLDSAMITAAALETGVSLQAYHARFSGLEVSEDSDTQAARATAKHFNIPYTEITINSWDALRFFGRAINEMPQPLGDPVVLPFYLLFKSLNKAQIYNVLTGEGGDQLFGSWSMKPMLIRELYPEINYSRDLAYLASYHKFHDEWQDLMSISLVQHLARDSQVESPIANAFANSPSHELCNQLRWVDLQLKGVQHILPRIEALANTHKLQLCHPFFQPELINSALNLPAHLKLTGTQEKVLLKKMAASHLPAEIIQRRKQGMGVPTSRWFRYGLQPLTAYWLNKKRLQKSGLLNPEYVRDMVIKNRSVSDGRARRWGDRLWQLCALECWFAGLNSDRGI